MSEDKILVRFLKASAPYNPGEVAGFARSRAIELVRGGHVELVGERQPCELPEPPQVEIPEGFETTFGKPELEVLAEALGLEVEGSGANDNVLKDDLIAAIMEKRDELENALPSEDDGGEEE